MSPCENRHRDSWKGYRPIALSISSSYYPRTLSPTHFVLSVIFLACVSALVYLCDLRETYMSTRGKCLLGTDRLHDCLTRFLSFLSSHQKCFAKGSCSISTLHNYFRVVSLPIGSRQFLGLSCVSQSSLLARRWFWFYRKLLLFFVLDVSRLVNGKQPKSSIIFLPPFRSFGFTKICGLG